MPKKYTLKLQMGIIEGDIADDVVLKRAIQGDVIMPVMPIYMVGTKEELVESFRNFTNETVELIRSK